jgi:hypothetical protein
MMDFHTEALHHLRIFAALNKGKLFTAEEVTEYAGMYICARENRKWGPVFRAALRSGDIKFAGGARRIYVPRYNGSPQPVYTC